MTTVHMNKETEMLTRPRITKHRTVLRLLQDLRMGGYPKTMQAQFGYTPEDEDNSGPTTKLNLNHGVWEELGQPTTLTVTIEPGDLLNDAAV